MFVEMCCSLLHKRLGITADSAWSLQFGILDGSWRRVLYWRGDIKQFTFEKKCQSSAFHFSFKEFFHGLLCNQMKSQWTSGCLRNNRVATAQGKQGIWFLLFPDRENTGNFALTQGKILRHRENIFL